MRYLYTGVLSAFIKPILLVSGDDNGAVLSLVFIEVYVFFTFLSNLHTSEKVKYGLLSLFVYLISWKGFYYTGHHPLLSAL
jgi:hypothetical protein